MACEIELIQPPKWFIILIICLGVTGIVTTILFWMKIGGFL